MPPSVWIERFLSDPRFCKLINRPVAKKVNDMQDITDGNIWEEFSKNPLFNDKGSQIIGLSLNVYCFKPFDCSVYKESALMMSVINYTYQEVRGIKKDGLWCIIQALQSQWGKYCIFPLILLLKISYYYGMESAWNHEGKKVKAALLGNKSDKPELRKISQFVNFSSCTVIFNYIYT